MENINTNEWFYHYTDAYGLQGILNDGAFWATDANYLNDFKEIQLGIDYARYWLEKNRENIISRFGKTVENRLDMNMNPTPGSQSGQRMFVCSFTTESDSLSQWRAYGKDGGYAVGFLSSYMKMKASELGLTLSECVYEHDEINNPVALFLDQMFSSDYLADFDDTKLNHICIMRRSILLKGGAFKQEREWRLTPNYDFGNKNRNPQKFRIRNGVFVPYLNYELFPSSEKQKFVKTGSDSRMPVAKLMIGPTPHKELAANGIRKLLWDLQGKYRFLSPQHSSASFRDW